MGVDIHMSLISYNGIMKSDDIFEGRNGEWFDNLKGEYCHSIEYEKLNRKKGIPERVPAEIRKDYDERDYYGYTYINVGEFRKWFNKYRPDLHAGWVRKYDAWLYEKKGIEPDIDMDVERYLDLDANPADWVFIEFVDSWDCSAYLYAKLNTLGADDSDNIVFYFDC